MSTTKELLSKPDSKEIVYHLDVFNNDVYEDILGSNAWAANNDPAIVDDVNIRSEDGLTIKEGDAYSPSARTGGVIVRKMFWRAAIVDNWDNGGISQAWSGYNHNSTSRTILNDSGSTMTFGFIASTNILFDAFDIKLAMTDTILDLYTPTSQEYARLYGIMNKTYNQVTAHIQDSSGNIIGNSVQINANGILNTVTGLKSSLIKGNQYSIILNFVKPNLSDLPYSYKSRPYHAQRLCDVMLYNLVGDSDFQVPVSPSTTVGFEFYGNKGFQLSGTAWRSLSFGSQPTDVAFNISDRVPTISGASLSTRLYSTNDDLKAASSGVVGWTDNGVVVDGNVIATTDRHFRLKFSMAASPDQSEAPFVYSVSLDAAGKPLTYSQKTEVAISGGVKLGRSIPTLDSVAYSLGSLSMDTAGAIDGSTTCSILADDRSMDLLSIPLLTRCRLRMEVVGADDMVTISAGELEDVKLREGFVDVVYKDSASIPQDATVPQHKHPTYSGTTAYAVGDTCSLNGIGYSAKLASTGITPPNTTYWLDIGTIWVNKKYTTGTHLADIALDMIQNEVNISDRFIDFASFAALKVRFPNRVLIAPLTFDKQLNTRDLLKELALLLESAWCRRDGLLSIVPEGKLSDSISAVITDNDIDKLAAGLQKQSEVNTVIMPTSYSAANGYSDAVVAVDTEILATHRNKVVSRNIFDRFGLDALELDKIAANYIARRKGGRLRIQCNRHIRLNMLKNGDLVQINLTDKMIHKGLAGSYTMMVEQNVPKNEAGSIKLTEVKT